MGTRNDQPDYAERRDKLCHVCRSLRIDGILISDACNVHYLTGFRGTDAALLLSAQLSLLISDGRFIEQMRQECPQIETYFRRTGQSMPDAIAKAVRMARLTKVGFESHRVAVADWRAMEAKSETTTWVEVTGAVERIRQVKDRHEITLIRTAIRVAQNALDALRPTLCKTDDEKAIAHRLDYLIRQTGGDAAAFQPIIASGARSAQPHAVPESSRYCNQDLLLVDWGAQVSFYHSDLTRVLITRKISAKLARLYEVVKAAHRAAIAAIRPGVAGAAVDASARKVIAAAGYGSAFRHGLGHGLGLQVHEAPSLRPNSEVILRPGMVVTVEPGIYLRGWGGVRLEDDVLVTRDGCEMLSRYPRNLDELIVAT